MHKLVWVWNLHGLLVLSFQSFLFTETIHKPQNDYSKVTAFLEAIQKMHLDLQNSQDIHTL